MEPKYEVGNIMAYVKGFNPGQLCLDLPSSNYYYELPLFSFGDTHGSIGVSLAFDYSEYSNIVLENDMNGLTNAISSQMGRMFATAMVSYGISTVAFAGMDAGFDYLGWWFF